MIFDEADLLERLSGDTELLAEVIAVFLDDCPARLQAINDAMTHRDPVELRTAAHAIKGAAGSLSAHRLFDAAQRLEHLVETSRLEASGDAVGRVTAETHDLIAALRRRAS